MSSSNCCDSSEHLPDNVLYNIINQISSLDDLFNLSLVNRRWYDLVQYKLTKVVHLIGYPTDNQLQIQYIDTLFFDTNTRIPIPKKIRLIMPNIKSIVHGNLLEYDNYDDDDDDSTSSSFEYFNNQLTSCRYRTKLRSINTKGLYIYDKVGLNLYEPSVNIELDDSEVGYLKTFLDLLDLYGHFVESLTILTLDCPQLALLSNLLTGNNWKVLDSNYPKYPEDVQHLTIGIPVWYDFRYIILRCPQLHTLYFLARDSWNLEAHHQFDCLKHNNLRNFFLEFWVNDYCHIDVWTYVKVFPKLRQLAIRDHPKLDDSSVYSLMISLRYLDNLDVRGCPKVSPSSTEKVIWNAQCDLPHRVNYFCGPYERVKFVKINSDFIFTSWKPGTINPFDLYSMFARQLLCSGQKLI